MILIVDNYDSFTYNLVQAVGAFDPDVVVVRNDRFESGGVSTRAPRRGRRSRRARAAPRTPAARSPLILAAERRGIPLLGVCLGHQAIGACSRRGGRARARSAPREELAACGSKVGRRSVRGLRRSLSRRRGTIRSLSAKRLFPPELAVTARTTTAS